MEAVFEYLLTSPYASYAMAFFLLCRVFTTLAPASLTAKIPDVVMVIINKCALASNSSTDDKGNPVD